MKKILIGVLVLALTLSLSIMAFASNGEKAAIPSQTKFVMDGKEISLDAAYLIDGQNYLQLRGVAELFSGTESQFNVYWDNDLRQAVIETGKPYTGVAPVISDSESTSNLDSDFKIGDIISMKNATLRMTEVKTSNETPPDEYGSKILASSGHTLLCISFEVTANSLGFNNNLWHSTQFIKYATAASGVAYEMPFAQGAVGFGANEKQTVTVYIEVPANETITGIVISDGANESATISIK